MVVTEVFVYCSMPIVAHVKYQLILMAVVPFWWWGVFSVYTIFRYSMACMHVLECVCVFKNGKRSSLICFIFFFLSLARSLSFLSTPSFNRIEDYGLGFVIKPARAMNSNKQIPILLVFEAIKLCTSLFFKNDETNNCLLCSTNKRTKRTMR